MSGNRTRVLVVDDEPAIRRLLRAGLGIQDYDVVEANDVASARMALASPLIELVILDLGLPDGNGMDLLRAIRAGGDHRPVLVLSSRADEKGKVEALDCGADDYVTKPFSMNELVARIRTAFRHRLQGDGVPALFEVDQLSVDLVYRTVRRDGVEVKLSPKEYDLLRLFVTHAGKVLTHAFILRAIWGPTTDPQQLRVYIRQLRHKIEHQPDRPSLIVTETGVGYRFKAI